MAGKLMEKKERKMIGLSVQLHENFKAFCAGKKISMTTAIDALITQNPAIDWNAAKKDAKLRTPTFNNVRRSIAEYKEKYPTADALTISRFTGFSHYQCRVVMHEANVECIAIMTQVPDINFRDLATQANVSEKFAIRMLGQKRGEVKIPQQEHYLWPDVDSSLPR
jgi:hypothetical protein